LAAVASDCDDATLQASSAMRNDDLVNMMGVGEQESVQTRRTTGSSRATCTRSEVT